MSEDKIEALPSEFGFEHALYALKNGKRVGRRE